VALAALQAAREKKRKEGRGSSYDPRALPWAGFSQPFRLHPPRRERRGLKPRFMHRLVFSPKGWEMPAQGSALGTEAHARDLFLLFSSARRAETGGHPVPQSLAKVTLHVIFGTKMREPMIGPSVRKDLHAYIAGALKRLDCPPIEVNGAADHVHILCRLSRKLSISDLVEEVKKGSSKWMKTKSPMLRNFYWQGGYAVSSVSESNVKEVKAYVAGQEEHHRKMTFQEEFVSFLKRHGFEYDERYIWE